MKRVRYLLWFVAAAIVIGGLWLSTGEKHEEKEKPAENKPMYVIEEIIPGQVITIRPIWSGLQPDNLTLSMEKVEAGMKEVGLKYRVKYGETTYQFTTVLKRTLYVEPLSDGNCSIYINSTKDIIINGTAMPG